MLSSKLELAKKFKHWVTSKVLPTIRKYGYYKLVDNPNNHMFKIENETDLHCKVVQYIRRLCENQDTVSKRINSWTGWTDTNFVFEWLRQDYFRIYTTPLENSAIWLAYSSGNSV